MIANMTHLTLVNFYVNYSIFHYYLAPLQCFHQTAFLLN